MVVQQAKSMSRMAEGQSGIRWKITEGDISQHWEDYLLLKCFMRGWKPGASVVTVDQDWGGEDNQGDNVSEGGSRGRLLIVGVGLS